MSADDVTRRGVWTNHGTETSDGDTDMRYAGHITDGGRVVGILPIRYKDCDHYGCKSVAVIDPDDFGQVESLSRGAVEARAGGPISFGIAVRQVEAMQAALRALTQPPAPPKPDEPGQWGVVTATSGLHSTPLIWIHRESGRWYDFDGCSAAWDALSDVTVIRPGIAVTA